MKEKEVMGDIALELRKNFGMTIFVVLVTIVLAGCDEQDSSQSVETENWVNQEILLQLKEMRVDIKAVKDGVTKLNDEIASAKAGAGQQPRLNDSPEKVSFSGRFVVGDDKAKIAIIEFTDYQCPYCSRHSKQVLPKIKQELIDTGKVRYQVRDYPLGFHKQARGASIAANCAGKQNQYLGMHDVLFSKPKSLKRQLYMETAKALNLDTKAFEICLDDPISNKEVDEDIAYGNEIGVKGTPKFFVGIVKDDAIVDVRVISGAQPYAAFAGVVEKLSVQ